MRNFIFASIAILSLLNCKKSDVNANVQLENTTEIVAPKFVIDSVSINDSTKINEKLTARFANKVLVFPSITNKNVLDSIYANIPIKSGEYTKENLLKSLQDSKSKFFNNYKEETKDYEIYSEQTWYENSEMNVFSNEDDILTIVYESDGYGGGAHGYYSIVYKNFDWKENKTIQLSDVFTDVKNKEFNKILMKYFKNEDQKEMLLVETIDPNSNFYFKDNKMYFVYNQYEITAYAAGVIEISVPISELSSYMKPEFKTRMNFK